jgi:hypothetical protein
MPTVKRSNRPVIYVINYILYALAAGFFACYMFVTGYGGSMPPPGSFDDFIKDMWPLIAPLFSAPVILTLLTAWFQKRKTRSADR